jgi:PhnB protein
MTSMKLNPAINLTFDGQCEAAFKFYERCLDGKITYMLTWGDSPMATEAPAEWRSKINHATLVVDTLTIQGSDAAPGAIVSASGYCIMLHPTIEDAERVFTSLAEGGTIRVPFQKTFWAAGFGILTDRFGIPWGVNAE